MRRDSVGSVLGRRKAVWSRQPSRDGTVVAARRRRRAVPSGASAGGSCPDTWGNAGFGTSCTRWQYVRSLSTDRDVHLTRAVRQRVMASNTFSCCPLIHLRLRSTKDCPPLQTMSPTSREARFMLSLLAFLLF